VFVVAPTGELASGPEVAGPVNGILGFGYQGGAGVVGRGDAPDQWRPGLVGRGTGGNGVVGQGGSGDAETNAMEEYHPDRPGKFDPGAGVVGMGGHWIGPDKDAKGQRLRGDFGGTGVVGVGGGSFEAGYVPSYVFAPGFGVYGISKEIGVCGVSAPVAVTDNSELHGLGVFGWGQTFGVYAQGGRGGGVKGHGGGGPGGHFKRDTFGPQLHVEPMPMQVPPEEPATDLKWLRPSAVDKLPGEATAGDILVTRPSTASNDFDPQGFATLWFCSRSGGVDYPTGWAVWQQILLGPPIKASHR
jgi:hypothetical protein